MVQLTGHDPPVGYDRSTAILAGGSAPGLGRRESVGYAAPHQHNNVYPACISLRAPLPSFRELARGPGRAHKSLIYQMIGQIRRDRAAVFADCIRPLIGHRPGSGRHARRVAQRRSVQGLGLALALARVRAKLKSHADGDRQFVKVLGAVLDYGLTAVEVACALESRARISDGSRDSSSLCAKVICGLFSGLKLGELIEWE